MQIIINNQTHFIDQKTKSLEDLVLQKTNGHTQGVAVALNGKVIPKNLWAITSIAEKDQILILTATQGG